MKETHKIIIDQTGRHIIGKLVKDEHDSITLSNPIYLFIQMDEQRNQIQIQPVPLLMMEFLDKDNRDKNEWVFHKSAIVTSNVVLSDTILKQYEQVNTPKTPDSPQVGGSNVVSIDDL